MVNSGGCATGTVSRDSIPVDKLKLAAGSWVVEAVAGRGCVAKSVVLRSVRRIQL